MATGETPPPMTTAKTATDGRAPVRLEVRGAVGLIWLDRPRVHNAVDDRVVAGLEAIADRLDVASDLGALRALVVTGAGSRTFSAGGDLGYFHTLGAERGEQMSRRVQGALSRLVDGPRPVIAAVNGDALGGGCELMIACHLRLASARARFSFRQAAMGVVTGWGGGVRLLRELRRGDALRLLLAAETIDADEALRIGLIHGIIRDSDWARGDSAEDANRDSPVVAEAVALADVIAANAPAAVAGFLDMARALDRGEDARAIETARFGQLWAAEHFRGKLAAWAARRREPHDA